jgi:IS5 family transposase
LEGKDKDKKFYTDSAYSGKPQEKIIAGKGIGNRVFEKRVRNRPLTDEQKANDRREIKDSFQSRAPVQIYINEYA